VDLQIILLLTFTSDSLRLGLSASQLAMKSLTVIAEIARPTTSSGKSANVLNLMQTLPMSNFLPVAKYSASN